MVEVPVSRNIAFLSFLYFVQGLPYGLQSRFLPVYFRTHGMSLSNVGFFKLLLIPWMCKALWAPFVDHYGTKKKWLVWSMVGLVITCFIGSFTGPEFLYQLASILFLFNLLTSTQDIAVDGLAIQILTSSELAHGNIAQVVGYKFGGIFGGGLLTWLSDYMTWMFLFQCLSVVYILAAVVAVVTIPTDQKYLTRTLYVPEPKQETKTVKKNSEHNQQKLMGDSTTSDRVKSNSSSDEEPNVQNNKPMFSWIQNHLSLILKTEGTAWILLFVVFYKLGEQGALSMIPLFLIDQKISTTEVGFWTGMVGQVVSIVGSVLGGWTISYFRMPALQLLRVVSIARTAVIGMVFIIVAVWAWLHILLGSLAFGLTVLSMCLLLLLSGTITTATFTLMMQCSQRAPPSVQASHYTTMATLEVLGKLSFSVFTGMITDLTGYRVVFFLFTLLSAASIPFFNWAPQVLWHCGGSTQNKNH